MKEEEAERRRLVEEQERLKKSANHYIADGETMMKLLPFEN